MFVMAGTKTQKCLARALPVTDRTCVGRFPLDSATVEGSWCCWKCYFPRDPQALKHGMVEADGNNSFCQSARQYPQETSLLSLFYTFRLPSPCFLLCCSSHPSSLPVSSQKAPLLSSSIPHLAILFHLLQELLVIPWVMQG